MDWVINIAARVRPELAVIVIAATPVVELRGAIPLGIMLGLQPALALVLGVAGSLVPVPLILLGLRPMVPVLKRLRPGQAVVRFLDSRTLRSRRRIVRTGLVGLALLAAVPLPATGAWTAAIAASLLGLRFRPALLAITAGITMSGVIVTVLTLVGRWGLR